MKINQLLIILLSCSILLSLFPLNHVFGEFLVSSDHADEFTLRYSNDDDVYFIHDIYWIFFSSVSDDGLYYANSTDGETWTENSRLIFHTSGGYGYYSDSFFDGTYIHLSMAAGGSIFYRRILPNADGTVTASAAQQTLPNSIVGDLSHEIVVDSSGYVYVFYYDNLNPQGIECVKNGNTDGSWSTASGYPKTVVSTTTDQTVHASIDSDDNIYVLYTNDTGTFDLKLTTLISDVAGTPQNVVSGIAAEQTFSSAIDYNNTLNIVYTKSSNVYFLSYSLSDDSFSESTLLGDCQSNSAPIIFYDSKTRDLYVSWFESRIFYVQYDYSESAWMDEVDLTGENYSSWVTNLYVQGSKYDYETDVICWLFSLGVSEDLYFEKLNLDPNRVVEEPFTIILSADLEDIDDDGADWVFTEWKYYEFTVTASAYCENLSLMFELETSFETVQCGFFVNSSFQEYDSDVSYDSRLGEPCILGTATYEYDSSENETVAVFPIWFTSTVLDLWDESDGVDVWGAYNSSSWMILGVNYFRIYNKGGFSLNTVESDSDAYVIPGSPFSFHCENGSSVYNEVWYRDVQHIKLLPTTYFIAGKEDWNLYFGCDYSIGEGEWIIGWWVNINPDFVSYTGVFAANVWINLTLTFNDAQEVARVYDSVYMFYHGSVETEGDRGWYKMFVDLWFSDKNSSSVTAARVNAYEYPMVDDADLWLRWLANNWGVKDNVLKELGCDHTLYDASGTEMSSERIKMLRYWSNLTVGDADAGQIIEVHNFDVFDVTKSKQLPLVGISTPVFDETVIPTMGQKGLLGALFSMFSGFGQWLSDNILFGGLNLWSNFVNFLDTIAAMFGAPKFFTNLFNWLAELFTYLGDAATYLIQILGDIFELIGSLAAAFLDVMGDVISNFVNTITMIGDMLGGAYGVGIDLWDYFNLPLWVSLAAIFYPLYLVILWEERGMDAVIQQLTWLFGMMVWLFNFMLQVIMFIIHLVERIVESIPVVE